MEFVHHSRSPFVLERGIEYPMPHIDFSHKPIGLWLSVDGPGSWEEWCRSADFGDLEHKSVVTVEDDANLLRIESLEDMDAFTQKYRTGPLAEGMQEFIGNLDMTGIDWPAVRENYDGIVIVPYIWGGRGQFMWYMSWDCSSACIWNLDAITDVRDA